MVLQIYFFLDKSEKSCGVTVLKLVRVNFSVFPCYYGPVNQGEEWMHP